MRRAGRKLSHQPIDGVLLLLDLDAQAGGSQRHGFREDEGEISHPDEILFGGDYGRNIHFAGLGYQLFQYANGVGVMVGEVEPENDFEAGAFQAFEELIRMCDAAKGGNGAVDFGYFQGTEDPPNRPIPATEMQRNLQLRLVGRKGENVGAGDGLYRLAQIARRQEPVLPVPPVSKQKIESAGERT